MIKVLTAIVVPPHMTASGAVGAAERLSAALSYYCDVTVASMMARPIVDTVTRASVRSWLPVGLSWRGFENRVRTLFYRSNIPDLVKRGDFDLVHIHNPTPALEMLRIAKACRAAGVPYLVTTHGYNEIANGHQIYNFNALKGWIWQRLVYGPVARVTRNADAVSILSPADIEIIRAMGFEGAHFLVPNGLEPPRPVDLAHETAAFEKFGIPPARERGVLTCMFLANHTPNKGLPTLLEAFRSLEIPFLLIVGGEKRSDVDYEEFSRSLKDNQRVIFTGRLTDDEIPVLMRRSDLFVFPTLADTLPLVIFEAMSYGLPVIASRVGGIPYQIDDECGALVSPGDAAELAMWLTRLSQEPDILTRMRRETRRRASSFGSWDDSAKLTMEVYRAVLAQSRTSAARSRDAAPVESNVVTLAPVMKKQA